MSFKSWSTTPKPEAEATTVKAADKTSGKTAPANPAVAPSEPKK